jgi:hyperosmotically inducible protein
MSSSTRAFAAAVLAASTLLPACERDRRAESAPNTSEMAAQAERQVEKAGKLLDDATITAKVKTALIAEPGLKGLSIDVDTSNNVVSLNGTVGSDAARAQAEEIARKTEGVKEVKNNLTVKASS